jgi:hypothetical protein
MQANLTTARRVRGELLVSGCDSLKVFEAKVMLINAGWVSAAKVIDGSKV